MIELFFAVLGALFSVVNPLGAVPVFLAMTPDYTVPERNSTARSTGVYFTLILLGFFFAGTQILEFFGIHISAMRIAGGVMILSSGYGLISGKFAENRAINKEVEEEALQKQDISFAPLAMPLLSGPGSISYLITQYNENPSWEAHLVVAAVIVLLGFLVYLILRSARYLYKILGEAGLKALSRVMGFIVMSLGVQYMIAGVIQLIGEMK
ncbi:MAG TPA: MarC family protein [Haliscomenobacter sp.]|uniref:MarC family protein n=1 Tax=Haliscomenobacter sp. TaxID=2717303 RepID=UPI002C762A5E|nr:MarC family protein [Haliscomenobacter sp.]HOY17086.1 MarC family protein [Haliscomenobacter sp.]